MVLSDNKRFVAVTQIIILFVGVTLTLVIAVENRKVGQNTLFERPDPSLEVEVESYDEEAVADENIREKRILPVADLARGPSLLFGYDTGINETIDTNFTIHEIMTRLQEKYEYPLCEAFQRLTDVGVSYFNYDTTLVYPDDGDDVYIEQKRKEKDRTYATRYRLYGEKCNPRRELDFWQEMFRVSENDTHSHLSVHTGGSKDSSNDDSVITPVLKQPMEDMLQRWNEVWIKYESKGVCNPRLLLECQVNKSETICKCLSKGVGLATVFDLSLLDIVPDFKATDLFLTQHYYLNEKLVNDELVRFENSTEKYKTSQQCALKANMPFVDDEDIYISNPCDFFLPMIGMCTAMCVENASCIGASATDKDNMHPRELANVIERVKYKKLHSSFHNKCFCNRNSTCRMTTESTENRAEHRRVFWNLSVYLLLWTLPLIIYCLTFLQTFTK